MKTPDLQRIVERAERLLSTTENTVRLRKTNGKLWLEVTYTDYKPVEQVRKNLRHICGGGVPVTVVREYSEAFVKDALYSVFCRGEEAILSVCRGELDAVPIRVYVNDMLDNMCSA